MRQSARRPIGSIGLPRRLLPVYRYQVQDFVKLKFKTRPTNWEVRERDTRPSLPCLVFLFYPSSARPQSRSRSGSRSGTNDSMATSNLTRATTRATTRPPVAPRRARASASWRRRRGSSSSPSSCGHPALATDDADANRSLVVVSPTVSSTKESPSAFSSDEVDDLFAEFAQSHCEFTARAFTTAAEVDARCMIYMRASGVGSAGMRLTRVASWPSAQTVGESAVNLSGEWDAPSSSPSEAIDWDAPEDTLASQSIFELPSANAVVACLTFEETVVGLLVVERIGSDVAIALPRERSLLEASAATFVRTWAIHRNRIMAVAAAYRADKSVGGYLKESKQPLTALRTLGSMLKNYLEPDDPAGDMASALLQQGDKLAELSQRLERVLYPSETNRMISGSDAGFSGERSRSRQMLPGAGSADAEIVLDAARSIDSVCDVTPVVLTLVASSDVVATSNDVVMRAQLPESAAPRTTVRADPKDVKSAFAQMIDVALIVAPRMSVVDVSVQEAVARGSGVTVTVTVDTSANAEAMVMLSEVYESRGLRIAQKLIQDNGGVLDVNSTSDGQELTMRARLPCV